MSKEAGGMAFPVPGTEYNFMYEGMTLRDYFAAKAMQGWLASYGPTDTHPVLNSSQDAIADISYQMADAMIKARGN